jgi:hypothetical protein
VSSVSPSRPGRVELPAPTRRLCNSPLVPWSCASAAASCARVTHSSVGVLPFFLARGSSQRQARSCSLLLLAVAVLPSPWPRLCGCVLLWNAHLTVVLRFLFGPAWVLVVGQARPYLLCFVVVDQSPRLDAGPYVLSLTCVRADKSKPVVDAPSARRKARTRIIAVYAEFYLI